MAILVGQAVAALSIVQTRGGFRAEANFCIEKGALAPRVALRRGF
jgi:hypothetical protein